MFTNKWDSVNDLMDGGLAGGELGVIVAQLVLVNLGHYKHSEQTQFVKVRQ